MKLSIRLRKLVDLVSEGYTVADIGTDHGYVPITLLREEKVPHAIAVDLSFGALSKAVENAKRARVIPIDQDPFVQDETEVNSGVSNCLLEFRLSDGLSALKPGEVDCIVISGMGGILMCNILQAKKEVFLSAKELVLSPHRDADLVRALLTEHGFRLVYDEQVEDKKKIYPVMKAVGPSCLF